jgi:hypothetical protein
MEKAASKAHCLIYTLIRSSRPLRRQHFKPRERRVGRTPPTRQRRDKRRDGAARMAVESAQVYRGRLPAARAGQREPRQPGRDGSADRRIEPQRAPTCLAGIPDGNDLMRFGNRLALGLGALGFSRRTCCGSLAFLRSAVRTHRKRLWPLKGVGKLVHFAKRHRRDFRLGNRIASQTRSHRLARAASI